MGFDTGRKNLASLEETLKINRQGPAL